MFDARPVDRDVGADPRTLALSLGSVQLLKRLQRLAGRGRPADPEVHVSQQPPVLPCRPGWRAPGAAERRRRAACRCSARCCATARWWRRCSAAWLPAAPSRPAAAGSPLRHAGAALKDVAGGVEVDAGIAEPFDLAVVAEGGVFARAEARKADLSRDYRQTPGSARSTIDGGRRGLAVERFTRHGPAALLPLPPDGDGQQCAALVWCVPSRRRPGARPRRRAAPGRARHRVRRRRRRPHQSRLAAEGFPARPERRAQLVQGRRCASATPRRRCIRWPARA